MRYSLALAAAILFAGIATSRAQTIINTNEGVVTAYDKSIALLIGEYAYKSFHWPRLPSIPNEIYSLKRTLEEQGFEVRVALNLANGTLAPAIKQFLQEPHPPATRLVVFYAGHGWTDRAYTGYIVPVDAGDTEDPQFRSRLVSMAEIKTWADDSDAQHILFLFDSCFSGSVFLSRQNLKPPSLFLKSALRKTRQFITAGTEEETVPAVSEFVPALIRGLKGEADIVPDGVVTGNELGYWLSSELSKSGRQTPQFGSVVPRNMLPGDVLFPYKSGEQKPLVKVAEPAVKSAGEAVSRSIGLPDSPDASVFAGLDIVYYQKVADGRSIIRTLTARKIPFRQTRAELPETFRTNGIACAPDTPIEAIKKIAHVLVDSGVTLRNIGLFMNPEKKKRRIEILSVSADPKGETELLSPPLTLAQIDGLTECPAWLENR